MVFARFPEVGKCKTRLISALGARAAAEVHRSMTVHTLAWAQRLKDKTQCKLEVHFAGGDGDAMARTFGENLQFVAQSNGDLGVRMQSAFEQASRAGAKKIVVVGTDCPDLDEAYAQRAFDALDCHEVCFGPALDGGYALLGINASALESRAITDSTFDALFRGVDWGTQQVLRQSVNAVAGLPVRVRMLRAVSDVDYPEDLGVWRRVQAKEPASTPPLTVIIPVAGIEERLSEAIDSAQCESAQCESAVEVIVVSAVEENGSSCVHTLQVAAEKRVQLVQSPRHRAAFSSCRHRFTGPLSQTCSRRVGEPDGRCWRF